MLINKHNWRHPLLPFMFPIYVLLNWFLFLLALKYLWMNFLFGSFSSRESNFPSLFSSWLVSWEFNWFCCANFLWISELIIIKLQKNYRNIGILGLKLHHFRILLYREFLLFYSKELNWKDMLSYLWKRQTVILSCMAHQQTKII